MRFGKLSMMLPVWAVMALTAPSWAQDASTLPYQNADPARPAAPLKSGANSFVESQAKALIESKGYTQVSALMNDSDGIWRGTATKDDRKVDVSVDFQGRVAVR